VLNFKTNSEIVGIGASLREGDPQQRGSSVTEGTAWHWSAWCNVGWL